MYESTKQLLSFKCSYRFARCATPLGRPFRRFTPLLNTGQFGGRRCEVRCRVPPPRRGMLPRPRVLAVRDRRRLMSVKAARLMCFLTGAETRSAPFGAVIARTTCVTPRVDLSHGVPATTPPDPQKGYESTLAATHPSCHCTCEKRARA
jgi:hypothetical protein